MLRHWESAGPRVPERQLPDQKAVCFRTEVVKVAGRG
jgi:hypothetical protein